MILQKAKEVGVGWVAARRSNHYSIAGYYGLMAAKEGLIVSIFAGVLLLGPGQHK